MKMVEREIFICDVCQAEYNTGYEAKNCEHIHMQNTCSHKNTDISYDDSWEGDGLKIETKCQDCGRILHNKEIHLDKYDNNAPAIYSIVQERTDEEQKILENWMTRLGIEPPITFDMVFAIIKHYERLEAAIIANTDGFTADSIWEAMVNDQSS